MIKYVIIDILKSTIFIFRKGYFQKVSNFYLNIIERFLRKGKLHSMPIGIDLIATTSCNFKCIYCEKYESKENKDISIEDFNKIADSLFPTLTYIKLGSATEHFLHKDFAKILKRCYESNLNIILNTNGSRLNKQNIDLLFKYKVRILGISLDGASKETTEKIRKGLDFNALITNIKEINRIKKELNSKYPVLTFNFVAIRENIEELPQFMDLMHELNVRKVRIMHLYAHAFADYSQSLFFYEELATKFFKIAAKKAKDYNINLLLPRPINDKIQSTNCYFPFHEIGITPNGDVAYCCGAWNQQKMGNLLQQNFRQDIWNSNLYQKIRRTVNTKNPILKVCRDCMPMDRGTDMIARHFDEAFYEKVKTWIDRAS